VISDGQAVRIEDIRFYAPTKLVPLEKAFHRLGERLLAQTEHIHANWTVAQG